LINKINDGVLNSTCLSIYSDVHPKFYGENISCPQGTEFYRPATEKVALCPSKALLI